MRDLETLKKLFRDLGFTDADDWAISEYEENIPQLATVLFIKSLIAPVEKITDTLSLRKLLRLVGDSAAEQSLRRLLGTENAAQDILSIVKAVLIAYILDLSFIIDETSASRFHALPNAAELEKVHWRLFETDPQGQPLRSMEGLHEVINEFLTHRGS